MSDEKLGTEIRKEQIAEAALKLVSAHGLNRLSVAAVARHVGLVPSGIYRHFRSKNDILAAVLDLIERRMNDNVREAMAESDDPLDQLRGVLVRHVRFIREGRAVPRIVFADETFTGHPQRKQRVHDILRAYLGHISRMIREGQRRGQIRREVNPDTTALLLLGIVIPAGILWHVSDGGFDVTRHAKRAWQILRKSIATEKASQ
jgi:AcrR family transcriptional regulator